MTKRTFVAIKIEPNKKLIQTINNIYSHFKEEKIKKNSNFYEY